MANKRNHNLVCVECHKPFMALRPVDKFCSSYCRWKNRDRSPERQAFRKDYMKKWQSWNFSYRRDYMLKYTYGITAEQYETILAKQDFCCAICERHESNFKRKMAVEHNHQTGEIQGIVCDYCNRQLLGKIRDPQLFRNAANYLENSHTEFFVPDRRKRKRKKGRI